MTTTCVLSTELENQSQSYVKKADVFVKRHVVGFVEFENMLNSVHCSKLCANSRLSPLTTPTNIPYELYQSPFEVHEKLSMQLVSISIVGVSRVFDFIHNLKSFVIHLELSFRDKSHFRFLKPNQLNLQVERKSNDTVVGFSYNLVFKKINSISTTVKPDYSPLSVENQPWLIAFSECALPFLLTLIN